VPLGGVRLKACKVVKEAQCLGVESSEGGGDNRHICAETNNLSFPSRSMRPVGTPVLYTCKPFPL
jgi:hypothetical protein